MSKGKVIVAPFGQKKVSNGLSKGEGVILIQLKEDGTFRYTHRGSLSHIEKIGMLTMALHSMELNAMMGGPQ